MSDDEQAYREAIDRMLGPPYVLGAVRKAREMGALTSAISCTPDSELSRLAELPIEPLVGPEILAGSTRMKAGTATKLVLNMISTGVMIRLGYTFGNLMVNVAPKNRKLEDRARRIVADAGAVVVGARENRGPAQNGVERRPQLVRQGCEEIVLGAARGLCVQPGRLLAPNEVANRGRHVRERLRQLPNLGRANDGHRRVQVAVGEPRGGGRQAIDGPSHNAGDNDRHQAADHPNESGGPGEQRPETPYRERRVIVRDVRDDAAAARDGALEPAVQRGELRLSADEDALGQELGRLVFALLGHGRRGVASSR